MRTDLWIVERRDPATGRLNFDGPQPEAVFGLKAIHGMTDDEMARVIFAKLPDAVLTGDSIPLWPRLLDAMFIARRRTW